ncbi:hypothetical protein EVJ32_11740 [Exiguobacterium sp. SH5S4]|uniref:hypothetical protein n=1 Tax=Exiguobacterium sp. SH5S4 TaxID=2510961 RepID=UPI00103EA67E|nr:hypothetical protein [Exiguobacterium sp. SH5S4]TCI25039.1 hypothetical protein EVJ32_11740 [Exiguobacterium sp. SH5S4]
MYKQVADYQFHQTVEWLERVGGGWMLYLAQTGFVFFDETFQIRWELEWKWAPCALYIEPHGKKAVALFRDMQTYGVIDLKQGMMECHPIPKTFHDDWFSNLCHWRGDDLFLYSAESDIVALNMTDHTFRYSRYEETPEFGAIIELAYHPIYDFERFTAPGLVTLYDELNQQFMVEQVEAGERWTIPYGGDYDTVIVDQVGATTAITSTTSFQLFKRDRQLFASDVCAESELLKVMLLDESGDRLVVLSTPRRFCHSWLQVFER